jgi:hypothetical protein
MNGKLVLLSVSCLFSHSTRSLKHPPALGVRESDPRSCKRWDGKDSPEDAILSPSTSMSMSVTHRPEKVYSTSQVIEGIDSMPTVNGLANLDRQKERKAASFSLIGRSGIRWM